MSARERLLLLALVALRVALGGARVLADPLRFWNFEEGYNATVAWHVAHGGLWAEALTLQYRNFCGGCTVVAAAATPFLALADSFVAWKAVALAWTATTMVVGFLALDRLVGRAGAWAFAVLMAAPAVGMADLSTMLWGNHQETALLGLLALFFLGRDRGLLTGLTLGFSVWFARTAAYQALVILPAALWLLRGQRVRVLLGFGAGLALLAVPAAADNAGFYLMREAFAHPAEPVWKRAATLLSPGPLAQRLYLPLGGMGWAAAAWLVAAGAASVCVLAAGPLRKARHKLFLGLAVAYGGLYTVTRFPLFLVSAKSPINNIRYHAPWAFVLTLLVAAGVGAAWARGWRKVAIGLVALPVAANLVGWARVAAWPGDLGALELRATDDAQFVQVATARLPLEVLAGNPANARARATLHRMYGLRVGAGVARGQADFDAALARAAAVSGAAVSDAAGTMGAGADPAGPNPRASDPALVGLGQAMVEPCADVRAWNDRLDALPVATARALGHGAAATLALCPKGGRDVARRVAALRGDGTCWFCEAAGAAALAGCEGPGAQHETPGTPGLAALGTCLAAAVAGLPEANAVLTGAGLRFGRPTRTSTDIATVAAAIGTGGAAFRAGAEDPLAGASLPIKGKGGADSER